MTEQIQPISKEEWIKGCVIPLLDFLAQSTKLMDKRTYHEWNEAYVKFCEETYFSELDT